MQACADISSACTHPDSHSLERTNLQPLSTPARYASFNYVEASPRTARLVKVDVSINGEVVDALSFVSPAAQATAKGRKVCQRLQTVVDRQQFEVIIQAKVGSKVLARERISPYRKDVLIKSGKTVGGGDSSRKKIS